MTDDKVTDIAARIAARAAGEQSFSERMDRIAAGIQILARAFEDMRAVGLDDSAIARDPLRARAMSAFPPKADIAERIGMSVLVAMIARPSARSIRH